MSNQPGPSSGDICKSDDYDPTLDITSDQFDPLKAITTKMKPPCPKAKVYDNLKLFEARLKKADSSLDIDLSTVQVSQLVSQKKPSLTSQTKGLEEVAATVRRFQPHQELVPKTKKQARNVLTRMENKDVLEGPLSVLHKFMENRTRVKIYTRKEHGVRGYVTGFIEAFDHHFNIGLRDAFEVYKRRKYAFSDNKVGHLGEPKDCSALLRRMGIDLPKVETVQSLNRKYVEVSRKCENMLIRGEQVVLVTKDEKILKS